MKKILALCLLGFVSFIQSEEFIGDQPNKLVEYEFSQKLVAFSWDSLSKEIIFKPIVHIHEVGDKDPELVEVDRRFVPVEHGLFIDVASANEVADRELNSVFEDVNLEDCPTPTRPGRNDQDDAVVDMLILRACPTPTKDRGTTRLCPTPTSPKHHRSLAACPTPTKDGDPVVRLCPTPPVKRIGLDSFCSTQEMNDQTQKVLDVARLAVLNAIERAFEALEEKVYDDRADLILARKARGRQLSEVDETTEKLY